MNELSQYQGRLEFYSTELDENLINWFIKSITPEALLIFPFDKLKKHIYSNGLKSYVYETENRKLEVFIGDLNQTHLMIKNLLNNIHAIYQDPFSPKKNPDLWCVEWFKFLKTISSNEVILSTYSASHSVQKNLAEAGWHVLSAPGFAHKRSSTRATLFENVYQGSVK